jgi:acetolactate synthase-1/2/3 large subunit
MAEVHGRLTGRPGVVAVSSGVAHANAMTGVVDAYFDGAPMLLLSGAAALRTTGMGHFQDLDQVALASPATKYSRVIDCPERTLQILDEAFAAAMSSPPGPVHLTFPMDMQESEVPEANLVRPAPVSPSSGPAGGDIEQAAQALAEAEKPLIVAGSGVHYARDGEVLCRFAEEFAIPVTAPIWDRGSIERESDCFVGVVGAATGGASLLGDADCIVMAGAVADYRLGYLQPDAVRPNARILRFDRGWEELGRAAREAGAKAHEGWLAEARKRRQEHRALVEQRAAEQAGDGLHAIHVVRAIKSMLTDDALLLADGGSIGQWMHQLLDDRYPGHWLTCGRSGVVGWGLGGAMGARLTYPGRPVVLLSGDGAFTFTVAEIECAVRQKLGFVAVVADDEAWGITQQGHLKQFGEAITSSLGPIDFVKLAESLGARGVRASSEEELSQKLAASLSTSEVTIIHARIVGGNP